MLFNSDGHGIFFLKSVTAIPVFRKGAYDERYFAILAIGKSADSIPLFWKLTLAF
jgi:hypothetical protein